MWKAAFQEQASSRDGVDYVNQNIVAATQICKNHHDKVNESINGSGEDYSRGEKPSSHYGDSAPNEAKVDEGNDITQLATTLDSNWCADESNPVVGILEPELLKLQTTTVSDQGETIFRSNHCTENGGGSVLRTNEHVVGLHEANGVSSGHLSLESEEAVEEGKNDEPDCSNSQFSDTHRLYSMPQVPSECNSHIGKNVNESNGVFCENSASNGEGEQESIRISRAESAGEAFIHEDAVIFKQEANNFNTKYASINGEDASQLSDSVEATQRVAASVSVSGKVSVEDAKSLILRQPEDGAEFTWTLLRDHSAQGFHNECERVVSSAFGPNAPMPMVLRSEVHSSRTLTVFNNSRKFVFLSDENAIPKQLTKLQEHTLRQRHEFHVRIHDLECKIVALTARLANETMDTDIDLKSVKQDFIYKPLEQSYQRMSLYCARTCLSSTLWISLEKRVSLLDSQMTHSVFVGYPDAKRKHIDILRDEFDNGIKIEVKIDSVQADKRERAIVRKFEDLAGSMARRYQEERSTRLASIQILLDDLKSRQSIDFSGKSGSFSIDRHQRILNAILTLRERLAVERVQRQENDTKLMQQIFERHEIMQTSIIEAFGDPNW